MNKSLTVSSSYTIIPTFGKTRGMKTRMLNWTYTMVIRPTLLQEVGQMEVNKLQRSACLATKGAINTTPTAAMEVLIRLPPTHVTVEAEGQAGTTDSCVNNSYLL